MKASHELFVISDLHIGGSVPTVQTGIQGRGFRINSHVGVLTQFLRELGERRAVSDRRIELVLNGDVVDFLAETAPNDGQHHAFVVDQQQALSIFDAIVARDRPFFDALHDLLGEGVGLTLVLGNHDVELSLPAVRDRLEGILGVREHGDYRFVYDGEAYAVGDVLIEHGNRYDGWNVVDHDRLRRHRSELSRRLSISNDALFTPPAGSTLVERVMNPIKREYPFIDLLKPETDAALPLLLALEPSLAGIANAIETVRLRRQAQQHQPMSPARPSQPGNIYAGGASGDGFTALRELLAQRLGPEDTQALMELVAQAREAELGAERNIAAGALERVLSFVRLRASPSYDARLKLLLRALRALRDDASFKRDEEGEAAYLDAARKLAEGGFAVIVFGHTHLAKQVNLAGGAGTYLNTGTWADLIKVPAEIVNGPEQVALSFLERFAQGMRDQQFGEFLAYNPTFAHICLDSQGRAQSARIHDYTAGCVEAL